MQAPFTGVALPSADQNANFPIPMSSDNSQRPVILTCAQPTGQLHLGNYLGAVRNWVGMIDDNECFFGVVDMHAITVPYVPAELRRNSLNLVAQYIACGLDPARCRLFLQSHVDGHAELAWILGCLCPLGQLERMTQFKDKSAKHGSRVGAGLLYYPVLMAADILIYNADKVPVGDDQKQHLELTRDLAIKFNSTYSPTFTVPEPVFGKMGTRIMSLQDPTRKMSKSDPNQAGTIYLLDTPDALRKKIQSAVTDTGSEVIASPDKPGISNLLAIYCVAANCTLQEAQDQFAGKGYAEFKRTVADAVIAMLEPIRTRYDELVADKAHLRSILADGAEAAGRRAARTMSKVYRKVGFMEKGR